VNPALLYLFLLKATATSFSGLASLPVLRNDLVVQRHVLTDRQLNTAVAMARVTPGPAGLYVVVVGYFAGGIPGAVAGWLAMITPAFAVILLLRYLAHRAQRAEVRGPIEALTMAAAGLVVAAAMPLARDAVTGALPRLHPHRHPVAGPGSGRVRSRGENRRILVAASQPNQVEEEVCRRSDSETSSTTSVSSAGVSPIIRWCR
jgi:chromate transporter